MILYDVLFVQLTPIVFLIQYLTWFFILIDITYSIKLAFDVHDKTTVIVLYLINIKAYIDWDKIHQFKHKNNHVTVLIRITGIFAKVKEWRDGTLSIPDCMCLKPPFPIDYWECIEVSVMYKITACRWCWIYTIGIP